MYPGSRLPRRSWQLEHNQSRSPFKFSSQFPVPSSQFPAPSSQLPAPGSRLPAPGSRLPAPGSQFPVPSSQFPAPSSQLPAPSSQFPSSPVPSSQSFSQLSAQQRICFQQFCGKGSGISAKAQEGYGFAGCAQKTGRVPPHDRGEGSDSLQDMFFMESHSIISLARLELAHVPWFLCLCGEEEFGAYSWRRLSTGSSWAARVAGTVPKSTPTKVETPSAITADQPETGRR